MAAARMRRARVTREVGLMLYKCVPTAAVDRILETSTSAWVKGFVSGVAATVVSA
jgi:hypothetical protein